MYASASRSYVTINGRESQEELPGLHGGTLFIVRVNVRGLFVATRVNVCRLRFHEPSWSQPQKYTPVCPLFNLAMDFQAFLRSLSAAPHPYMNNVTLRVYVGGETTLVALSLLGRGRASCQKGRIDPRKGSIHRTARCRS